MNAEEQKRKLGEEEKGFSLNEQKITGEESRATIFGLQKPRGALEFAIVAAKLSC